MTTHTKEEQAYIDDIANALRSVEITDKEMVDKSTNGIPFEGVDSRKLTFALSPFTSQYAVALGA